jgi:hypothetical protein
MDSKVWLKTLFQGKAGYLGKVRDTVRKVVLGINFVIVGVESQEHKDYAYPVRNMIYDAGEYEKQLRRIRKHVRKNRAGASPGEYLYGFRKEDRLKPVVTFLLYAGKEPWEKPKDLWDMLDFTDVSGQLMEKIQNYRVNVVDIRSLEDTSIYGTEIGAVFDFIQCSEDKEKLKKLVESKKYFRHMDEEAFDVAIGYAHAEELGFAKENYEEGGKVDMCTAIQEMLKDSRTEGYEQGELRGRIKVYADEMHLTVEEIAERLHMDKETIEEILDEID